jgi:hypothetical protein
LGDLISFLLFRDLFGCQRSLGFCLTWRAWFAHKPVRFVRFHLIALWALWLAFRYGLMGFEHSVGVCLTELRLVSTTVRVDIVRFHVLSIRKAAIGWICITVTVSMKSRFAKVRRVCAIRQESSFQPQLHNLFSHVLLLFLC